MLAMLDRLFFYQCACCDKRVPFARYTDGAYQCLECSRGEDGTPAGGKAA